MNSRYASVTAVVPNEGRRIGHVAVSDEKGTRHLFMNGSMNSPLRKFPELSVGDTVRISYTSHPSFALWFVKEKVS
jgi:hypothetical protein